MHTLPRSLRRSSLLMVIALATSFLTPGLAIGRGDSTPTIPETLPYPIESYVCEQDPGVYNRQAAVPLPDDCVGADSIAYTVSLTADGAEIGSCETVEGRCDVEAPEGAEVTITQDESTAPAGYAVRENPQTDTNATEFRGRTFFNIATDADAGSAQPTTAATETLKAETDGSTAAIYAGDCDGDFTSEPVATLTNVRPPDGDPNGASTASAVETSFTTLDLPLDDILANDHVLVVFDQDDDSVALACGAVGGIVTDDGSLTVGLSAVGESRFSGVAILSEDDEQTDATIFLAEDLTPDATAAA